MPYKDPEKRKLCLKTWKTVNRDHVNAQKREHYHANKTLKPVKTPEEIALIKKTKKTEKNRRYREKHKEKLRVKKSQYYQQNKAKILVKYLLDLKNDIEKRIAHNLRNRLRGAIERGTKSGSAVADLGCSIADFKEFISSKFSDGMSWENYGKWHLDHIVALCKFDLASVEEFRKAAHYTNYQPLWAKYNLVKNKY
jgi:hypothetical protein